MPFKAIFIFFNSKSQDCISSLQIFQEKFSFFICVNAPGSSFGD